MPNIETIARAIILNKDKILLCRAQGNKHYFLPGGHVEFGETAEQTLMREFKEELNFSIDKFEYIGTVENIFSDKGKDHHEMNVVFFGQTECDDCVSCEAHLEFCWLPTDKLAGENIEPVALKHAILKWLQDKKPFWGSERE